MTKLQASRTQPFSTIFVRRQLKFFGELALIPDFHELHSMVFNSNAFIKSIVGPLLRGRTRKCWLDELHALAIRVAGSYSEFGTYSRSMLFVAQTLVGCYY